MGKSTIFYRFRVICKHRVFVLRSDSYAPTDGSARQLVTL